MKISEKPTPVDLNASELFFLYRNGVGESLSAVNRTVTEFIDQEIDHIFGFQTMLTVLCCVFSILFLLFCCLLAPMVYSIQRTSLTVWSFFFDMQIAQILEAKSKCMDRLEREHGQDMTAATNSVGGNVAK